MVRGAEYGCAVCKPRWKSAVVLWVVDAVNTYPLCANHAMLWTQQTFVGEREAAYAVRDALAPVIRYGITGPVPRD